MSYGENTFQHLIHVSSKDETWVDVISAFLAGEDLTASWRSKEGGLRSENCQLVTFGYGWTGEVVAYCSGGKIYVTKGPFPKKNGNSGGADKARKMVMKMAKSKGLTPYWGKYSFEQRGETPLEVKLESFESDGMLRPRYLKIGGEAFYLKDNLGLVNGEGVSELKKRVGLYHDCVADGPTFVWSDDKFVMDDRGRFYNLNDITRWEDEVAYRVKENGECLLWFK